MPSDHELLEAWRGGDTAAGEALFERYFDAIYGFLSRKLQGDVADLVQTTFLKLLQSAHAFRGDSSVRTYLYVIAKNELYSYLREQGKGAVLDFSVSSIKDLGPSPSSLLRHKGDTAALLEALERLPLELQLVVELHYWEGLSGAELARVLELPEGTVRSRLRRALERLHDLMLEVVPKPPAQWASVDALDTWARTVRPFAGVAD